MSSLVDFLLARIAEDEDGAQEASSLWEQDAATKEWGWAFANEPAVWVTRSEYDTEAVMRTNGVVGAVVYNEGRPSETEAYHIARHDPARVLRDCETKRGLMDLHSGGHECPGDGQFFWDDDADWTDPCPSLRWLARSYADHPDYREEWKP